MTVVTLAIVAAVVLIVLLLMLVLGQRRRLERLTDQVQSLRSMAAVEPPAARAEPAPTPMAAPTPVVASPPDESRVAVITGLRADGPAPAGSELTTSRIVSVTLAGPMIKVAAFSHALRVALDDEHRMRVAYAFRKELKRQRKMRRRAGSRPPTQREGWLP